MKSPITSISIGHAISDLGKKSVRRDKINIWRGDEHSTIPLSDLYKIEGPFTESGAAELLDMLTYINNIFTTTVI